MALITCPDCQRQVSDRAPACPQCGSPLHTPPLGASQQAPRIIEATSKTWKTLQLAGGIVLVLAIPTCIVTTIAARPGEAASPVAAWCVLGGMILWLLGRIGGWWYHG